MLFDNGQVALKISPIAAVLFARGNRMQNGDVQRRRFE
jgi:hypothetical protein